MGAYVSVRAHYVCPRRKQKADEDEGAVKEGETHPYCSDASHQSPLLLILPLQGSPSRMSIPGFTPLLTITSTLRSAATGEDIGARL